MHWSAAIERFAASEFATQLLRRTSSRTCTPTVKRAEMEEFNSHITPLEIARYLGPL